MHALTITLLALVALCGAAHCAAVSSESSEEMAHTADFDEEHARDECIKELKLSEDELKDDDHDGKMHHFKVRACVFKKHGVITPDGKFSADMMIARGNRYFSLQPVMAADFRKAVEACRPELESASLKEEELTAKIIHCVSKNRSMPERTTTAKSM